MAYQMITLTALLNLVAVVSSAWVACPGSASYTLTFRGLWKLDRHPNTRLPGSAHFSPLVGCSHGSDYVMWRAGGKASPGVESVAEAGSTGTLVSEINAQITAKKAWKRILPGGSLGPEQVQSGINVEVTANFSKVSIITMLAPSPDWFIGIDSLDLCNNGTWRQSWEVTMLPPWDAGTEEGNQFSSSNPATNPHINIFHITNDMQGAFNAPNPILSLGEFQFQKKEQSIDQSGTLSTTISTENSVSKTSVNFLVFVTATLIATLFL